MRREAGVDVRELLRLRIVDRDLATSLLHREQLRGRVIRTLAAERRRLLLADARRHPDAPVLIEHRIVHRGLAVPDHLAAPIGRRQPREVARHREGPPRRIGVARRRLEIGHRMRLRIEDRKIVGGIFGRAVDRAPGIDSRVALVGRDLVMQVGLGIAPVPQRHHDVALDALRPLRLRRRQRAGGDACRSSRRTA